MQLFGGIQVVEQPISTGMPQKAQTAWDSAFGELVGAEYAPISFVGSQMVNGINYWYLAQQRLITADPVYHIVKVCITEFAGRYELTSIEKIF